jgi:hypothetical protein
LTCIREGIQTRFERSTTFDDNPDGGLALDDPITILAVVEAILGLFIEITFIATFTQRFFAR